MGARDALCGRRVGEFILRERIGEGGFAAVYRCEQPALGREAVVKVLHRDMSGRESVLRRFLREAQLASRLDHPYAAHVYAFGVEEEEGLFWIAMEMVHGTTLDAWLRDHGPLPLDPLVSFFESVAEVVQTAHDRGIVHRDLKPSNIMVIERAGRLLPKLLDFGIAKLLDTSPTQTPPPPPRTQTRASGAWTWENQESGTWTDPGSEAREGATTSAQWSRADGPPVSNAVPPLPASITRTGAMLGSPPYMSPEQWNDPPRVGPATDLYSLGIIAFEALSGRRPFISDGMAGYAGMHCWAPVPPLGDGFSPELDRFFQRALAKQPQDRPASALELAALLRAASGLGPARDAIAERVTRRSKLSRWLVVGAVGAMAAAGGVALALLRVPSDPVATGQPPPRPSLARPPDAGVLVPVADPVADVQAEPNPPAAVSVRIESTPAGADVFRMPSETRVGRTPWEGSLPAEDGFAVFVVRKRRFAERRIEVDLRTGGLTQVKLDPATVKRRRLHAPVEAVEPVERRRKGEPANPFKEPRP